MTSDDDFEKEQQFWLQHIQQLDDYTFRLKGTETNDSQIHSTPEHTPVRITCNDHEKRDEVEGVPPSNETLPSLDHSFATDEEITLQRRIVELAALKRSLILRLQTLDEEKRNLRIQHTQRQEAMKTELELKLTSLLSVLDGRWNTTRESIHNIASLSTKYTALLKGVIPSAGTADWDALFQEYQETIEKGKFLTPSATSSGNLGHQASARETNETQAVGYDHLQPKENQLWSMERVPHGSCDECQTSTELREMRDRYEETLRDLEHKHAKEIKSLRRLLKSQRCVSGRSRSPGDTRPKQAVTETPPTRRLERDSFSETQNTSQDLKIQSVSVEALKEAYKDQLQDIKFKTTRAIDQMKSEIHRLVASPRCPNPVQFLPLERRKQTSKRLNLRSKTRPPQSQYYRTTR